MSEFDRLPPLPPDPLPPEIPVLPGEPVPASRRNGLFIGGFIAIALGLIGGVLIVRAVTKGPASEVIREGWTRKTVASEKFSLDLPPNWKSVSTSSADEAFNTLKTANPSLAALVKDQLGGSLSSLIKLLAFDVRSPTLAQQFATNMNVIVAPTGAGVSFDTFVAQNVEQLHRTPGVAQSIEQLRQKLPSGDAVRLVSHLTVNAPGGAQEVSVTQYLFLHGAKGYIISFSTTPGAWAGYADTFLFIAETLRFI